MDGTLLRGGVVRSLRVDTGNGTLYGPWTMEAWSGYEPLATGRAGALVEVP